MLVMMVLPALAAGAVALGGQWWANRERRQAASKDRVFQSKEASRSRRFSERMRNTSWQAGIADMEAAGVNPALAYSQGGASSPMGAQAGGSREDVEDVLGPALTSAMQQKRLTQELKVMKARERIDSAIATREEGTNAAYGISTDNKGRLHFDLSMPGLKEMVHANVSSAKSRALLDQMNIPGMRNISVFEQSRLGAPTRTIQSLLQAIFGRGGAFKAR